MTASMRHVWPYIFLVAGNHLKYFREVSSVAKFTKYCYPLTPEQEVFKLRKAEIQREYYQRNKEEERLKQVARRAANPEKYKAEAAARYYSNVELSRIRSRDYYAKNPAMWAASSRIYRAKNTDRVRLSRRTANYGLTQEEFHTLWNLQAGRCAICVERLIDDGTRLTHIDHCHKSGEIRGILCKDCNFGLGWFKDSKNLLLRAHDYLNDT